MIARAFVLVAALLSANVAHAEVIWSMPASACTPSDSPIRFNRYATQGPNLKFQPDVAYPISFTCPITRYDSTSTSWKLNLVYTDSTGSGSAGFVRAILFAMPIGSETPHALAIANSNSSTATGRNTVSSPTFTHTFNFQTNVYWVRIEMDRSATSQNVVAHSIHLGVPTISDIRAKQDIVRLGRLENGLGFYSFKYNGGSQTYVGVMAQEVEALLPDAVVHGDDGYLRVFYDQLGFSMQTFEAWRAAGGTLPVVASAQPR